MNEEFELDDVIEEIYDNNNTDEDLNEKTEDSFFVFDNSSTKEESDESDESYIENIKTSSELSRYLDQELSITEDSRIRPLEFEYAGEMYSGIVMGKSKQYPNRYVFKIAPEWNLKAFWIDKITLI